jgi:hypothetical protein
MNGMYITGTTNIDLHGLEIDGGDYALSVYGGRLSLNGFRFSMFEHYGAYFGTSCIFNMVDGLMTSQGMNYAVGIAVDGCDNFAIDDVYLAGNGDGDIGLWLSGSSNGVIHGIRGDGTWDATAFMLLNAASDDNVVMGCQANGDAYSDLGAGNDLAHNK